MKKLLLFIGILLSVQVFAQVEPLNMSDTAKAQFIEVLNLGTVVRISDFESPVALIDSITARVILNAKTANYTIQESDAGKLIVVNSASNITIHFPLNVFPTLGVKIYVLRRGTGEVTITVEAGGSLESEDSMVEIGAVKTGIEAILIEANIWAIIGRLK